MGIATTAALMNCSAATVSRAIADGSFPVKAIPIGKRHVIPTTPLLEMLGIARPTT
ncbi:hypothetical protein [Tsukamurella pulmonis]|uniref:hypothetical protein n=1 Tax=Tsukamurella pulmonis TaxID=47312 RepID=UPI001EDF5D74|nr:hypothetical protein [Tsukamurella pulmonis]